MSSISIKTDIPGPNSLALLERRKKVVSNGVSMSKASIFAEKAEGALITDVDGNCFIDFTGGIGCLNSGHTPHRVVEAVKAQVEKYQHTCFQVTMYEPYVALAEKLVEITPGNYDKKVVLLNSGAEAVENAVKIARQHTKRQAIVCFENGFHGRTLLGLSLTSKVKPYKDGFGPFAPEIYQASLPYTYRRHEKLTEDEYVDDCIKKFHSFLKSTVTPDKIAAIIIEPVLGEGGFIVTPPRFIQEIVKICKDNGIVFIADEVQSGFGRTGKMFVSEHYGIEPDIMTLAKSMSNGFPISAVVGKAEIMDSVNPGGLGGTFAGNPVSCVAALATIETIEQDGLCRRSEEIGAKVKEMMITLSEQAKCIGEVRGLGAMVGIEIVQSGTNNPDKATADKIVAECTKKGLLILTSGVEGNTIRTLMPLNITDEQIDEALGVLGDVIKSL